MAEIAEGKRLILLELLSQHGEKTGVELRQLDPRLDDDGIYMTLARMEHDRHWLSSRKSRKTTGPGAPARWYSITAKGELAMKRGQWLLAQDALEAT